jgi:D-serine dehydratase
MTEPVLEHIEPALAQQSPQPASGGPRNLLREELALPAAVIYQSRLDNNLRWMQTFADSQKVLLAPHGKTTMTPAFFQRQRDAGAWGLTLASATQVSVAFRAGIRRVLMANQLVGQQNMALISNLLAASPQDPLDFYCLVDSADNVHQLGKFFSAEGRRQGQSLQLLLEIGVPGGRCGCRNRQQIDAVCEAIAQYPALKLAGVETYEGLIHGTDAEERVRQHLIAVREICLQLLQQGRFDTQQVILTGAGSAWYDLVAEEFTNHKEARLLPVIRPGCYLIHDRGIYQDAQNKVMARIGEHCSPAGDLISSLEVWAYVQSVPEAGTAILGLGKRDAAFDAGLPQPALHCRPGWSATKSAPASWRVESIMDQHCKMQFPAGDSVKVGDMIALSTSHPCLTFDKWRELYLIDDDYNILQRVETFF